MTPAPAPTSPDAVEMAMEQAAGDEAMKPAALVLIEKQSRLIDAELGHVAIQTVNQKIGLALKAAVLVLVVLVLAAAAMLLWQAAREPRAIVQPFGTPAPLEQRGIDGSMLASGLLDHLNDIAEKTSSRRRVSSYAGGWSDNVRVEIPNTGISWNDLVTLVRRSAGNETLITGELVSRGDVLELSARINGKPARRYLGREDQIQQMLRQAAEGIYRDSQPYRYAVYLGRTGREREQRAEYWRIHRHGEPTDRLWARTAFAETIITEDLASAKALLRMVLAEAPWFAYAREAEAGIAALEGRDEDALQGFRRNEQSLESAEWRAMVTDQGLAMHRHTTRGSIATLLGDFRTYREAVEGAAQINLYGFADAAKFARAVTLLRLHEPTRAAQVAGRGTISDWLLPMGFIHQESMREDLLAERGDWPAYWRELEKTDRLFEWQAVRDHMVRPRLAVARARVGRISEARAMAAALPEYCYRCTIAKAQVAKLAGRPAEADRWFARAVQQGPSLPQARVEWARALIEQRRYADAVRLLGEAHQHAPAWADPLKYWGDALLRQGRHGEALEKYREASERAPRWGGLHLHMALAAWRTGDREEARQILAAAKRMDLTVAERQRLPAFERLFASVA